MIKLIKLMGGCWFVRTCLCRASRHEPRQGAIELSVIELYFVFGILYSVIIDYCVLYIDYSKLKVRYHSVIHYSNIPSFPLPLPSYKFDIWEHTLS